MGRIAFVFPGQGAQYPGMGRELYARSGAAKAVFDCAEILRPGTVQQCFEGTAEELQITENTQPCLYCADLAAAEALREAGVEPDMLAGFSLGELAALTFSGAVDREAGFRLVCRRAALMQRETLKKEAGMLAVLKLEDDAVSALCAAFDAVYPVNFNSPGQVVVAGEKAALERFRTRVAEAGGKSIPLKVSGGFHSPFMDEAAVAFADELEKLNLRAPAVPLYANVTAQPYSGAMKNLLSEQIRRPVRWRQTVENMIGAGADTFVEVGPGKVLSGLIARISKDVRVLNVADNESLSSTLAEVKGGA